MEWEISGSGILFTFCQCWYFALALPSYQFPGIYNGNGSDLFHRGIHFDTKSKAGGGFERFRYLCVFEVSISQARD
jgi:hypothetical protein